MEKNQYEIIGHVGQSRKKGVAPIAQIVELSDGYWAIDVPSGKVEANVEKIVSEHNAIVVARDDDAQKLRAEINDLANQIERKNEEIYALKHGDGSKAALVELLKAKDAVNADLNLTLEARSLLLRNMGEKNSILCRQRDEQIAAANDMVELLERKDARLREQAGELQQLKKNVFFAFTDKHLAAAFAEHTSAQLRDAKKAIESLQDTVDQLLSDGQEGAINRVVPRDRVGGVSTMGQLITLPEGTKQISIGVDTNHSNHTVAVYGFVEGEIHYLLDLLILPARRDPGTPYGNKGKAA